MFFIVSFNKLLWPSDNSFLRKQVFLGVKAWALSFGFWKLLGSKILKSEEKKCLQTSLDRR